MSNDAFFGFGGGVAGERYQPGAASPSELVKAPTSHLSAPPRLRGSRWSQGVARCPGSGGYLIRLPSRGAKSGSRRSASTPCSSNRTCGPALGQPIGALRLGLLAP